jgi:hypothetical protein
LCVESYPWIAPDPKKQKEATNNFFCKNMGKILATKKWG